MITTEEEVLSQAKLNGSPFANSSGINPGIYEELPYILYDGCKILIDPAEKAVFLIGALGVISGLLPKIYGIYDGMTVYPNIFVYILSPYGGGKGKLIHAKELGMTVHRVKKQATQENRVRYEIELEFYQAEFKAWKKNKIGEPPIKPLEPSQYLHYIPANNSNSGFVENLNANGGAGTVFETEGDTLAENVNKEYGINSDGLRKAFHHESFSFNRRLNKEFVEVEKPRLSVILSSTFDQLLSLIPTAENGLFSRFLFFRLTPNPTFKNVFEPEKAQYQMKFEALGKRMAIIYNYLNSQEKEIEFQLSKAQQAAFVQFFQELKTDVQQNITIDLDGTINRLGLQFFRIAMILTTLRQYESGNIEPVMICTDNDFELTRKIIMPLYHNAIDIFSMLPLPRQYDNKHLDKAENVKLAIELHNNGLTYSEISQRIFNDTNHKSTIYRWIRNQ